MTDFSFGDFIAAIGLAFVLEGLVFLAAPSLSQRIMAAVSKSALSQLRIAGLISAGLGLLVLWLVRG